MLTVASVPAADDREGANKQVISSQADSLIKNFADLGRFFSRKHIESAYLGYFSTISGVISGFY
ncbi:hypothetical protein [Klebsiella pneumoniae]|uniref:hypothetical protein n=1 Tax=Klebsiella pneumoniae TaxID=573 RepID=UPI000735A9B7|nr:hypothetical protein [Klebsiella pneumoniae]